MQAAYYMIPLGMAFGAIVALVFKTIPAEWLLDYNDTNRSVAKAAQNSLTFFPGILLLMLVDGAFFLCSRLMLGSSVVLPVILYIAQPLLLIILSDLKTRIIPDQFIVALIPGGLMLWIVEGMTGQPGWGRTILFRLLAALVGGFILWSCGWVAGKIMKRDAMGMGDVKLLAACSFIIGWSDLLFLFCLSFLLAALVAIPLLIRRIWDRQCDPEIAFGPYIALATALLLTFSEPVHHLWQSYIALVTG